MNADLENTLAEMGPGFRAMVNRMKEPFAESEAPRGGVLAWKFWRRSALAAAALVAACVFAVHVLSPRGGSAIAEEHEYPALYTLADAGTPESIAELVRTQNPDGGWGSDFLTRRNAAALKGVKEAEIPYKRALRYLRAHGLRPATLVFL